MLIQTICITVLAITTFEGVVGQEPDSDPYTVEMDSFEIYKQYDQKFIDWDTLRMKQQGRNKFVTAGTFKLNLNLADDQKVVLQVFTYDKEKKTKGPMIFNVEKEVCRFIAEDEDVYPGLQEKSNMPSRDTCPIPKQEYEIDNYEVKANFLPANTPAGTYLIVFLLKDGVKPVAGFEAELTIERN